MEEMTNAEYNCWCDLCKKYPGMSVAFSYAQAFNYQYFNEIQLVKTDKNSFENILSEFFYNATKNKRG